VCALITRWWGRRQRDPPIEGPPWHAKVYIQLIDDRGRMRRKPSGSPLTAPSMKSTCQLGMRPNCAGRWNVSFPWRRIRGASGGRRGRSGAIGWEQTQRIREWAVANGYSPSSRRSISQDIKKAYDAAHAQLMGIHLNGENACDGAARVKATSGEGCVSPWTAKTGSILKGRWSRSLGCASSF
jgi:hypothetical protein